MRPIVPLVLITAVAVHGSSPRVAERALPNNNRAPAGSMVGDTLVLRLTLRVTDWRLLGDDAPGFTLLAFAEEGKPATIPGPLIRTRVGTPVRVIVRNPLDDTLVIRGLTEHAAARDSLVVLPGATNTASFLARRVGTYFYWVPAYSIRAPDSVTSPSLTRRGFDSQLAGAIIVDSSSSQSDDRVFVITELADRQGPVGAPGGSDRHGTPTRQFNAINGRSWPQTERLRYALGDSIRWRIVNASQENHPLHLHGFYFRVDSHGAPQSDADSIYGRDERRMAVTETITNRHTASITWSPDRAGGWLFHCHLTNHATTFAPIELHDVLEAPAHHTDDPDHHAFTGMNGLVLGITVGGAASRANAWRPAKRLRLFIQSDSVPGDRDRRFGYVLQRGAEPKRDSIEYPGSLLVLTRGQPTSIEVVNHTGDATAVHWHGIELESYYDGVAGWSGTPERTAPAIKPGQHFEVRVTPRRAGTFMYHTHLDELRQQYGGLVAPLVVLEPGQRWDPTHDLMILLSDGVPQRIYINGSLAPSPKTLAVGQTYRLRLADIAVFRMSLTVQLVRDSALLSWRAVAKDGYTLPPSRATLRPSVVDLPSGETADFEFTPDRAGDAVLQIIGSSVPNAPPQAELRFHVVNSPP
ncbi:MAG TPA: multicopper oxidase domain-containing protein [Gemmatimonadaceae bacterium]|nr:multicopper oxidase domain-containing protein [Gemmatimonadaceae bacterium]